MIDFNDAPEQKEAVGSAIPEGSIIPLKITIRSPKAGKQSDRCEALSTTSKGIYEMLDVEFEAQGTFHGRKIWETYNFKCELIDGKLHFEGTDKTTCISMGNIRAIIESAKGILPKDPSPQAASQKKLSSFFDLNGLVCLAKVKAVAEQSTRDGQWYINNKIASAGFITPDKPEYAAGEFISDKPLPTIPDPGNTPTKTTAPPAGATAAWGAAPGAPAQQPPPPAEQQKSTAPIPAWAQR